jgi:hypothetical protein
MDLEERLTRDDRALMNDKDNYKNYVEDTVKSTIFITK